MSETWVFPALAFGAIVGVPVLVIAWAVLLVRIDRAKGRAIGDMYRPDMLGSQDIDSRYRARQ